MSALTDRLYREWLSRRGDGGEHIECERAGWRSKRARGAPGKAERRAVDAGTGAPIHNSLKGPKNHGINKL